MADDYTPTTEDVRYRYLDYREREGDVDPGEFDRWLAGVIAEKRAEWEGEQGEVKWEYRARWDGDDSLWFSVAPERVDQWLSEGYEVQKHALTPWVPVNEEEA